MIIKKYYAETMAEAVTQVRADLGSEAVILSSKPIFKSGGLRNFFKKKKIIEVIASVDPNKAVKSNPEELRTRSKNQLKTNQVLYKPEPRQKEFKVEPIEKDTVPIPAQVQMPHAEVLNELTELKKMVKSLNASKMEHLPESVQKVMDVVKTHDISSEILEDVLLTLMDKVENNELSFEECKGLVGDLLLSYLPNQEPVAFQKKYINVVGPTGVGKTTTLAKLASEGTLRYGKSVAFITTDTYRIGAIEQLKTYATILQIPIQVAYNFGDFQKALEQFSHYDLVLIDTSGRNFRNEKYVKELKSIVRFDEEMETYLVLSLTSKQSDMEAIFKQFSLIPISNFIFTKMDETSSYGAMFNMMAKFKMNTAFVTNGQGVPDDIVQATPSFIVKKMLEVEGM